MSGRVYPVYPVRVTATGVYTLDGVQIGGAFAAAAVVEGFEKASFTETRTTEEIIEGTGVELGGDRPKHHHKKRKRA